MKQLLGVLLFTFAFAFAVPAFASATDTTDPEMNWGGSILSQPSSWIGETSDHLDLEATDAGSGVVSLEVKLNGEVVALEEEACPGGACSLEVDEDLDLSELGDGLFSLTATATDDDGNITVETESFTLDHAIPEVTLDGLPPSEGGQGTPEYEIHIDASDPDDTVHQSGVVSVVTKVDGSTISTEAASCPGGGCDLQDTAQIDASLYASGEHTLTVVVSDGAGNQYTHSQTFETGPDTELPIVNANLGVLASTGGVRPGEFEIPTTASDPAGSGVESLAVEVDSVQVDLETQACSTGGCSIQEDLEIDASLLADGTHDLSIVAIDAENNVNEVEFDFTIDRALPEIELFGDLSDSFGEWVAPGDEDLSVDVKGYVPGEELVAKLWINSIEVDSDSEMCLGSAPCSETLSLEADFDQLTGGRNEVEVTVENDGHLERRSAHILVNKVGDLDLADSIGIEKALDPAAPELDEPPVFLEDSGVFPIDSSLISGRGNADGYGSFEFDLGDEETANVLVGSGNGGIADPQLAPDGSSYVLQDENSDWDQVVQPTATGIKVVDVLRSGSSSLFSSDTWFASDPYVAVTVHDNESVELVDDSDPFSPDSIATLTVTDAKDAAGNEIGWSFSRDRHDILFELLPTEEIVYPVRVEKTWELTGPLIDSLQESSLAARVMSIDPWRCKSISQTPASLSDRRVSGTALRTCSLTDNQTVIRSMTVRACIAKWTASGWKRSDCNAKTFGRAKGRGNTSGGAVTAIDPCGAAGQVATWTTVGWASIYFDNGYSVGTAHLDPDSAVARRFACRN